MSGGAWKAGGWRARRPDGDVIWFLLCSIKPGKVVVVLAGRFAGRKAVVVKALDDGSDEKKFGHALGTWPSGNSISGLLA